MARYMTKYNVADLLRMLVTQGLVENEQEIEEFILGQQQDKELPLYLKVLVGVGAFIASICFIGFLSAADIISLQHKIGLIIWGLIFVAGAIVLQQLSGRDNTVKYSFLLQSSFALMVVGKILFVLGVAIKLDSGWAVTMAALIITMLTYHIYRVSTDRFLSSFIVLFSILVNVLWSREVISISREILFNGFFLIQFAGAAILLMHGKIKRDYIPLSYAFTLSLCVSVLFLALHVGIDYWRIHNKIIHPVFINILLAGGLIMLAGWVAGGIEKLKRELLILVSFVAVLLGFISAPGIILSIGLIVLGYSKHEKLLIIEGVLLIPIFLFLYYYNLDVSLMQKSGVLVGSGIVLLAGGFYLKHRGWVTPEIIKNDQNKNFGGI